MSEAPNVNDQRVRNVISALSTGHYMERAARLANVNPSTVYVWKSKGEDERKRLAEGQDPTEYGQRYLEILEEIERAQEQAAHRSMTAIQKAAQDGSWQAAAWYLERTDHKHYGRKTTIVGNDDGPIQVQNVSSEEVDAKLKLLIDAAEASEREATRKAKSTP
jgi:transposase-like protein